ncbi:hypothetical protein BCR44DRAFT_37349 [Catenaria anguillulae PL171]|uniref:Uncharacterized protein n=1 Tax=Catenaria anguillulae PL171 TaxID=765915 RepID=A0A1Y2HRP3_9FUNG|nr:hypothetical protein BCR44DRAFT_37349 [Catenaria anguillulae PL171]
MRSPCYSNLDPTRSKPPCSAVAPLHPYLSLGCISGHSTKSFARRGLARPRWFPSVVEEGAGAHTHNKTTNTDDIGAMQAKGAKGADDCGYYTATSPVCLAQRPGSHCRCLPLKYCCDIMSRLSWNYVCLTERSLVATSTDVS